MKIKPQARHILRTLTTNPILELCYFAVVEIVAAAAAAGVVEVEVKVEVEVEVGFRV